MYEDYQGKQGQQDHRSSSFFPLNTIKGFLIKILKDVQIGQQTTEISPIKIAKRPANDWGDDSVSL